MNSAKTKILLCPIAVALVGVLIWSQSGYGKVSRETYEYAKALYSACLSQNEARLTKVSQMIQQSRENSEATISEKELNWLQNIVSKAESGNWESASTAARRMMEDQVEQ